MANEFPSRNSIVIRCNYLSTYLVGHSFALDWPLEAWSTTNRPPLQPKSQAHLLSAVHRQAKDMLPCQVRSLTAISHF